MYVDVRITGDQAIIQKLIALGPKLLNFEPALGILGRELKNYYAGKAYASQGGVFGEKWQALSPIYAARKGRNYPGRGILVATGEMQRSFTTDAGPNLLVIGNDAPQFKYHQSTEPRSKMPRRPMLGINTEVKTIVKTVLEADIKEKLRTFA